MLRIINIAITVLMLSVSGAAANAFANEYCKSAAKQLPCVTVQTGQRVEQFTNNVEVTLKFNRQNTRWLMAGQKLVVVPNGVSLSALSPFKAQAEIIPGKEHVILFDPNLLAWAHYQNGVLQRWGPAVGGKKWCPDIGRSCMTKTGVHTVTEAANAARRSSAYPVGCTGRGCAPLPYFTRFTGGGQGFHIRTMPGANASHGCIGVFPDDAVYINNLARQTAGRQSYGYFTTAQIKRSDAQLAVVILPYE